MDKYNLIAKPVGMRNKFKVTIKADSNDADYITNISTYSRQGFEEIVDALKDLRDNYSGSHQLKDYQNEFDLDIPFDGYDGYCHTLERLDIEYVDEDGVQWDVQLA